MYIFKYLSLENENSHNYDDHDDNDDDKDDNEVSLGIFVAVLILLKFLSFLLVLPEYCLTPPHPPTTTTTALFLFDCLMFGPHVHLSDFYP